MPFADLGITPASASDASQDAPLYVPFGKPLITTSARLATAQRQAKLDDGRSIELIAHRVRIIPLAPTSASESVALRWLGGVARWTESDSGIDLVEARLPVDAFGHWLWSGERRVPVEWLSGEDDPLPRAAPDLLRRASDPFVRECLRLESVDPRLAWRAALLNVSITKPSPDAPPIPFATTPNLIESPRDAAVIDRLAQQFAALWRVALASLRRSDADLHRQVVDQLTLVLELDAPGGKRLVPAWPGPDRCGTLLDALLRDRNEPRRLAAAAREWLRTRPAACAWVADDAGILESSTSAPLVRIGVANLQAARTLVSARGVIDLAGPELTPLEPRSAAVLPVAPLLIAPPADGAPEQWGIDIRCGDWSAVLPAQRRHFPVLPPGRSIGELALDHSIEPWSRSQSLVPLANPLESRRELPALAGRVVRDAGPGGVGIGSGWSLYLEVERGTGERQTIRVWFGPFASPSAVVTAELPEITSIPESGEGTATVRLPGRGDAALIGARVVPSADRWTIRLPVPNSAIERPGRLRLAVEHLRGDARSTWPRAQFPWQTEPGRASLDLSTW
ncbi:MAG TPA: hypothetical protein VF777_02875 [Phycisphaerales bacterium]